jgi:lysozyme family protein
MQNSFPQALKLVLASEGGNDDDPADHGGRTSRGITQKEYSAWRAEQGLAPKDVWTASDKEVKTIYHDEYWNPYCDKLPIGIDYLYFDMAVNAGPYRATVLMQRALGVVDDGRVGPVTRQALTTADPIVLIDKYTQTKRDYYISLHQPKFTRGWLNRCDEVRNNAISLLGGLK